MEDGAQREQDRHFMQNLITNNTQVIEEGHEERKAEVVAILNRIMVRRGRRGGPTKAMLIQLCQLCPGQPEVLPTLSKTDIVEIILQALQPPNDPPPVVTEPVEGWEQFFGETPTVGQPAVRSTLLRLVRGELSGMSKETQLDLLLKEQEEVNQARERGDRVMVQFVKDNMQEMSSNPVPLPPTVSDENCFYIYEKVLEKKIKDYQCMFSERSTVANSRQRENWDNPPPLVSDSSDTDSSDDADLRSFLTLQTHSAVPKRRKKSSKKRKRRRKKKRKKKRSHSSNSSDDSSTEESESSSDEVEPNAKRVSASSYGPNHLEQMQEFRDDYKAYVEDGHQGEWPTDEALTFISKKFGRAGTKFASKSDGVKRRFISAPEREHARKRTVQIYGYADTIAQLRLERNQQIAKEMRRLDGAKKAKRARIKNKIRKFQRDSVHMEQTYVSKVSMYCDLVLQGKKSWDDFHNELGLGGQRETVVEGMGGMISNGVAAKAWKSAQRAALKPVTKKKKRVHLGGPPAKPGAPLAKPGTPAAGGVVCYYCTKKGHMGRDCPVKRAGKPCHPASQQAKWDKADKEKAKAGGVKVQRPP